MSVVINARFEHAPLTGVQRYAGELARRLVELDLDHVVWARPPRSLASSGSGHLWEQTVLPARAARAPLLSLANWGPILAQRHVLAVHDLAPLHLPEHFNRRYRVWWRAAMRCFAARRTQFLATSTAVADDLHRSFGVGLDRIAVAPPGLADTFRRAPDWPARGQEAPFCLLVGGHDSRKNARFVTELWPRIYRRTGTRLVVTHRSGVRVHATKPHTAVAGVAVVPDPDDDALLRLYSQATLLLAPSRYEGFGLPLLEAAAQGTPFVSTATGVAPHAPGGVILPLVADAWVETITARLAGTWQPDTEGLRRWARGYAWHHSVHETVAAVRKLQHW